MSGVEPVTVWIGLGSNRGRRRPNLERAVDLLRAAGGISVRRVSSWVETEPVGGPPGQRRFRNGVLEAETTLAPGELLAVLQDIEARLGRDRAREVRDGPRPIDLDLLLYGDEEVHEPGLDVPHPRLEERVFVLAPMAQLAPERRLPASGRTVRERLAELASPAS